MKKNVLLVFGTRPEAIKMAILARLLREDVRFNVKICVTGQHRELLDQVLNLFEIEPDFDLNLMSEKQTLSSITNKVISGVGEILHVNNFDIVLVHGDTTTSMATALVAYYNKVTVGHVEAGLRTYDIYSPWPEEINRQLTARISTLHFAPTLSNRENLLKEGVDGNRIFVTGNTVIDSLKWVTAKINANLSLENAIINKYFIGDLLRLKIVDWKSGNRKLVLITGHRRENFGEGFENIVDAIKTLSNNHPDTDFVYPVHLNPNVRSVIEDRLGVEIGGEVESNLIFLEPLDYLPFIYLMQLAYFVLTDSGGVQEEAPSIGIPVLVMRDTTERPEALESGAVRLVGAIKESIIYNCEELLTSDTTISKMKSVNVFPYGEGDSSVKIIEHLIREL